MITGQRRRGQHQDQGGSGIATVKNVQTTGVARRLGVNLEK